VGAVVLSSILAWLAGNPLDRILKTVNNVIDNDTQRDSIKAEVTKTYLNAQAQILSGHGWWFPLLFLFPAGAWFSAVVFYSILFCKLCVFPQPWSVAALPAPLDDWITAMIASLFIGRAAQCIWRK
jgi:hypothetical protein